MIELTESYTISKEINDVLVGKKIRNVILGNSPHKFAFFLGDKEKYNEMLSNETIISSTYAGGLIIVYTDNHMLYFADGAVPKYYKDNYPNKYQFAVMFEDNSGIFISIQMYGFIGCCLTGKCDQQYYLSSTSKYNPLNNEFTYEYFKDLYIPNGKKMSVKAFLATSQRIPGIGNGIIQDVLFKAHLHPQCDMKNLKEEDFKCLYDALINVVNEMCEKGGRNTEKDLFDNYGKYHCIMSKNTLNQKCPNCGGVIEKTNYMGGTVYFCNSCQRK